MLTFSNSRETFDTYLSTTKTNAPEASVGAFRSMPASSASIGRLQRSRRRLGSQRHDLIIALRVVNSIEREMVEAEWEGWLHDESAKCRQMDMFIREKSTQTFDSDHKSNASKQQWLGAEHLDWSKIRSWHEIYCGSCSKEMELLEMELAESAG